MTTHEVEISNDGTTREVEVYDGDLLLHTYTQAVNPEPVSPPWRTPWTR